MPAFQTAFNCNDKKRKSSPTNRISNVKRDTLSSLIIPCLTLAAYSPRIRTNPTKLTKDTRGDSQGRRTTSRRTPTVPEEDKPPPPSRSNDLAAADGSVNIIVMPAEQSNGSPDSILSGSLDESANSAPDSADSLVPTAPFPPLSHSPGSFATSEPKSQNRKQSLPRASARGRTDTEGRNKDEQRAFGSPVSVDEDDARF